MLRQGISLNHCIMQSSFEGMWNLAHDVATTEIQLNELQWPLIGLRRNYRRGDRAGKSPGADLPRSVSELPRNEKSCASVSPIPIRPRIIYCDQPTRYAMTT